MNIASAFGAMVGVGAAARISIRLGEGNKRAAEDTLGNAVLLNIVLGVSIMLVFLLFLDPILIFFSGGEASAETLDYARRFMRILMFGNIITHLYLGLNEQLRASGYPRKAMYIMLLSMALCTILNPLFIFGFSWSIGGSAYATVIAQSIALLVQIHHYTNKNSFLRFRRRSLRFKRNIVGAIISIAILKAGLEMLTDTLNSIVGSRADADLTNEIKAKLRTVDGILGAYDLVLHNYGPTKTMAAVNVAVYDWRTAEELHAISKKAQQLILDEYGMNLYVGFYAVNTKMNGVRQLELDVSKDMANYKYVISIHAFYENPVTTAISFDAVIDFKCKDATYLVAQIEKDLSEKYGRPFHIQIDRAYSD
jgi:hypothetical protein